MPIETSSLLQKAVLWELSSYDDNGQSTVSAAVGIDVRWEYTSREAIGPQGAPILTSAVVMVDRVISQGSIMRLGNIDDLPTVPNNLHEVVSYDDVPDVKAQDVQGTVTLQSYKKPLPTVV